MARITPQSEDFSKWYLDVIKEADMAENSAVRGCMVIKPWGYAIWENIQREMDLRIKALGVRNCYFPMFIPESFLTKEKDHIEGFAPECAVVTHGGGKKLEENLFVRPTSETIIYDTYSRWVQSHRDLPLLLNQWANVVRWEMRTRPFLRTTEFLWQEGHTVHATSEDAAEFVEKALNMYATFDKEFLCIPVVTGKKSRKETFAGALYTMTTEALAKDGKAIQAGTSHHLGQTFAKAFGIQFQDTDGELKHAWQTSWGVSTRIVGTLIVCLGDDKGLRLPPTVAPIQVVLIPIWKDDEGKKKVLDIFNKIEKDLREANIRVHLDDRDNVSPGFKFNEYEVKGVPIRIEMGPRDFENGEFTLARRDTQEKITHKIHSKFDAEDVQKLLDEIQENLYKDALDFREANTHTVDNMDDFKKAIEQDIPGFVRVYWCGDGALEERVQDETKATIRIIEDENVTGQKCFYSGKDANQRVLFAKSY
ncbi:MAG: proline--tRNA ligase [Candidatus Peregrinibacteria bacterium]|nr:proline--tRNA ligase [Candidatus Peregrinibacteria bacterium]MDZ4244464.1 proline--tRNA ligase [Candidatus Gracilibacteria bacterium]